MYDPTDDSNRPVKGVHTNAIRRWPIYPEYIREAFVKAFSKNSMNGTAPRIIEKEWQELLTRMRDDLAICEHCGNETFVHYDREMICINCGKPVKVSYSLKTSRYNVPLLKGKYLYKCHTNDVSTRDYIRSLYGSNIILEQYQGMNKTLIEDKREGNTVEDWDLNSLKVGEAVVGLPFEKPFKFYFDNFG